MRANLVGIDINMVFQLFNTLVLFILLRRFLFGPVSDFMKKRKEKIEIALKEAEEKNSRADQLKEEYERKLADIEKEAEGILREASSKAEERRQEILKEAKEEAGRIIARARREIQLEKEKAISEVKEHIINVALGAAGKLIEQNLDTGTNRRIVRQFIDEVGRVS
jgi:F-type H+-transporting ATPase subunit b